MTSLHLHPVKGCHRIEVDRATAGPYGLVGDREWQIVPATPTDDLKFLTQRRHPQLTGIRPALAEGGIVLRATGMPDLFVPTPGAATTSTVHYSGESMAGDGGDEAARWLTEVIGEPVRLHGIAPGYERRFGDVFPTQSNLGDLAPILVANDASHAFLAERAVEPFGPERWRANVWVDGGEPWAEDTWRSLRIGDAQVTLALPWPRCAVPQVDQEDGTRHREPAVVLAKHRRCPPLPDSSSLVQMMLPGNALFGMAGAIEPAGAVIRVGDAVEVVETGAPLITGP